MFCLWAQAQQISVPWHCGFEEDEAAEISQWVLNPGTAAAKDKWTVGKAVRSERKQSLYISTDQGLTASYGDKRDIIIAYRLINMPVVSLKEYDISFDYRTPSENGSLYVFFDYSATLIDGTDEYQLLQYASANRADGIPKRVLEKARYVTPIIPSTDASRHQEMRASSGWTSVSIDCGTGTNYSERISKKNSQKQFALVFMWINRNSNDSVGIGACLDNVQIASATVQKPTEVKISHLCADSSITLTWKGGLDGYLVGYRKSTSGTWRTFTYTGNIAKLNHSYTVSGLKDGLYDFRVCGWKKYQNQADEWITDTTGYVTISNYMLYCPENQCINFADLDNADCTYGPDGDLYAIHKKMDYGWQDVLSLHTVNTDPTAYDIRTLNKLKIVPDNAMVSVRLGNWYNPGKNKNHPYNESVDNNGKPTQINGEAIRYSFVVDSANSAILLLRYAMVFEESLHERADQPYFKLSVLDQNGTVIGGLCGEQYFYCPMARDESPELAQERIKNENWQMVSKEDFPVKNEDLGFNSSNIWWKDWSTMGLNLSEYDGQMLDVVIESRGCGQSAHYGYGYFTLGCASATIETEQCGETPSATADAPAGFEYQWYAKKDSLFFNKGLMRDPHDGHIIVVSHSAELTVKAGDTQTYVCHMSYLDSPDCFFELETALLPRNPWAMHTYSITSEQCRNLLALRDSSRIVTYNSAGDMIFMADECDFSQWTVRSLVTGKRTSYSGTELTFESARTGDTIEVVHTTYISDGECDNTRTDTIIVPDITTPDSLIYDTICDNYKYAFGGNKYNKTGIYYDSLVNQYGCDSVEILYLEVKPTSMVKRVDTVCSTNLPYVMQGTYKGEKKRYEFTNDLNYISTTNHVVKLDNRYNCDSTINLELTIIPLLKAEVDSIPVLCSDENGFSLDYHVTQGDYDSLKITFSAAAHQAGLRDTVLHHDPYTKPTLPPADGQLLYSYDETIMPNIYHMYVQFYQHPCCGYYHIDTIPIDIRYANSIIVQKWNDVLALLNEQNNVNHQEFTAYQWYKNDQPIEGATKPYLYDGHELDFDAEYKVLLTRLSDSIAQFTCAFRPERRAIDPNAYPTMVQAGSQIRAKLDKEATVVFYTLTGAVYSSVHLPAGESVFTAPYSVGYYILSVASADKETVTRQKILITP
jgi:hypothetical protein